MQKFTLNPIIEKIYFNSPIPIQNIMTALYGYKLYRERYIGNHAKYLRQLAESQWASKVEIDKHTNGICVLFSTHSGMSLFTGGY